MTGVQTCALPICFPVTIFCHIVPALALLLIVVNNQVQLVQAILEPQDSQLSVSILSYNAFFVGTSRLPFHPAPYTSSGTLTSQENVAQLLSAYQLKSWSHVFTQLVLATTVACAEVR